MSEPKIKKPKAFRSLRVTLVVSFLILGFSVLIISSVLNMYVNFQNQQKLIASQQNLVARDAANTVSSFILQKFDKLETGIRLSDIINADKGKQKLILERLMGSEPSFRQIVLLDIQGNELVSTSRLSQVLSKQVVNYSDNAIMVKVKNGEKYISSVYVDEITSEPMIVMAVPVKDLFGNLQNVLVAETNLKFMWDLVGGIKIGEGGLSYVVDKQGNLIAFSDISRVLKGENLLQLKEVYEFAKMNESINMNDVSISKGIQGNYVVSTHVHLSMPDWAVVTELPVLEAYRNVIWMLEISAGIMIMGFLLAIVSGFYLSGRIIKPIIKLRDVAIEIGKGNLNTKIKIETKNEIGELASTFNQMLHDLKKSRKKVQEYSRGLERKVKQRTWELSEKVRQLTKTESALLNMTEDMNEANKKLVETQRELKRSLQGLKELDVEKDKFISIAAHELKTPMTAIHGFAQLLTNEKIIKDVGARNKYLGIIGEEIKRLSKLVTDVLELSRSDIGTLKLSIEEVDIPVIVERVKESLIQMVRNKGLKLNLTLAQNLSIIKTDKEKLEQILINLISNATKYTERGGIKIGVAREGNYIKFTVADTGIGIPRKHFKHMFKRFYQIDSPLTRKVGGSGLGLSICKEYVEALGGKICFKSKAGKGSTFYFTLPLEYSKKEKN